MNITNFIKMYTRLDELYKTMRSKGKKITPCVKCKTKNKTSEFCERTKKEKKNERTNINF